MIKNRKIEALTILQEEAAEVIQAVSKIKRFGFEEKNRIRLAEEVGDLMLLLNLVIEEDIVDEALVQEAMEAKTEKLKRWSNLFTQ